MSKNDDDKQSTGLLDKDTLDYNLVRSEILRGNPELRSEIAKKIRQIRKEKQLKL